MFLAFRKKCGFVGYWIDRLSGKGGYQHAAVIFEDGRVFETHFGKGVHFADYKPEKDCWVFYRVPCRPQAELAARHWAATVEGKRYDTRGTVDLAGWRDGGLIRQSDDRYFCSELCVYVCWQAGHLKDLVPHRESPNTLEKKVRELKWDRFEALP